MFERTQRKDSLTLRLDRFLEQELNVVGRDMYLKVKRDKLRDKASNVSLRFEILQAYRDTVTQRPRNRLVAYLGSFRERDIDKPMKQEMFWRVVDAKLAHLKLSQTEEYRLRSKLLETIPRPDSWLVIMASILK